MFEITRSIYAHKSVVEALRGAHHQKCCYCERKIEGDVEHFRPKTGYQQSFDTPLHQPGYYWLAYEWSNLYFACGPCNQRHKKNMFPLRRPGRRATSHHDKLEDEEPLLLNPSEDDPMQHIGFREEVAFSIGGSRRGDATINVLKLNREDLIESRRDRIGPLLLLKTVLATYELKIRGIVSQGLSVPNPLVLQQTKIRDLLQSTIIDAAEYASMCRAAMK